MSTARASARSSCCVREDLLVPALLLAERGIEIARPALRSPRTKTAAPRLVAAVVAVESHFKPRARNPRTGASGLMQLAPATAHALGVTDPMNPRASISGGCRYLRNLLDRFHHNLSLTLAAYNAGPTLVARIGRVPPFPETRRYVAEVTARYRHGTWP